MEQLDGSHYAWLEDRGPELVLMTYINDAKNNTFFIPPRDYPWRKFKLPGSLDFEEKEKVLAGAL